MTSTVSCHVPRQRVLTTSTATSGVTALAVLQNSPLSLLVPQWRMWMAFIGAVVILLYLSAARNISRESSASTGVSSVFIITLYCICAK